MLDTILTILILAALVFLFIWLATRAGRSKHALVKWPGMLLSGLIALLPLAILGLVVYGQVTFKAVQANRPLYQIQADTSPASLERGKYLVENVMGCAGACHSPQSGAPFSGNTEIIALGPATIEFNVPNLTSDPETGLAAWSDAEIARAMREGVDRTGRALAVMPAFNYHVLSDADMAAILGYLRTLPPTRNQVKPFAANALGKAILASGILIPPSLGKAITSAQTTPAAGTVEYGAYLVSIAACRDCHKPNLAGGSGPGPAGDIPAANLTPGGDMAQWSQADFLKAMHTGVRPDGTRISPNMPYEEYGKMNDEDLAAIFKYLQTIPAVASK